MSFLNFFISVEYLMHKISLAVIVFTFEISALLFNTFLNDFFRKYVCIKHLEVEVTSYEEKFFEC